ncbi:MAG: hypothetical protein AB1796_14445 [Bacillota bacterium]
MLPFFLLKLQNLFLGRRKKEEGRRKKEEVTFREIEEYSRKKRMMFALFSAVVGRTFQARPKAGLF